MKKSKYNVAVVGVGAVGEEMLRVLKQRKFPINELKVLARSSRDINVDGVKYSVREIKPEEFSGVDIALFAGTEGDKGAAVTYAPVAIKAGAVVIDNGADFRMDKDVPLIVPEVNPEDASKHKGIIANPNCSTIQMVVALKPIYDLSRINRVIVSTYQAVSGAGRKGIEELKAQSKCISNKEGNCECSAFPRQIAFNVIPHISKFEDYDYTTEEWKMIRETHKIMHDDKIKISATTVRVPVLNGHSESVYLETEKPLPIEKVREALKKAKGIVVIDEKVGDGLRSYPMPIDADGKDDVFVGRIRKDPYVENGLWLWVVADNLRKGAASNAVQIAELL